MTAPVREKLRFPDALMLVNAVHPIRIACRPDLVPVDAEHPDILLDRRAAGLLNACIRAVGGQGQIVPVSGWRSRKEQQAIWDDTLEKEGAAFAQKYVARPGCSEHETGLAIDLGLAASHIDFIRPDFPDSGVCAAFRRRAAEFGFILRYPADKQAVTGIAHEPWHFRYVGVPHAMLIAERGLVLEEYVALLRRCPPGAPLEGRQMGRAFCVYFQPEAGFPQPQPGLHRTCSRDNCGGWIVTQWQDGEV